MSHSERKMFSAACRYSYSRFVLNYYMYDQVYMEHPGEDPTRKAFHDKLQAAVRRFLDGDYELAQLDDLREELIREVEAETAFTDCFEVYEYVCNRLEGRFEPQSHEPEDEEEFVYRIMEFLAAAPDSPDRNERIKMILGQLPIRFTKTKFFAYVSEALSLYEGADKKTFTTVLELLRSEALLDVPKQAMSGHEKLAEIRDMLEQADFRDLTAERFQNLKNGLRLGEEALIGESEAILMLMDLVNDLYVILLSRPRVLMEQGEENLYAALTEAVYDHLAGCEDAANEEELEHMLVQMEGRQESFYEQWTSYKLPEGSEPETKILKKIDLLLSSSSFMPLEEEDEDPESQVLLSKRAVELLCEPFFKDLEESWAEKPRCVIRAIMAKLLAALPMFFSSADQLQSFFYGCLSTCTDAAERNASMRLIQALMENEEDDLV